MTSIELRRTRIALPPIDVHGRLQPQRRRRNHRHRRRNPSRHRKRHCLRTPATRHTYVWGGSGPDVFDCSELTSARIPNYRHQRFALLSAASQLRTSGRPATRTDPRRRHHLLPRLHPIHDNGDVGIAINATQWIVAPKTGDVISLSPIPFDRIQTVRRLVTQAG